MMAVSAQIANYVWLTIEHTNSLYVFALQSFPQPGGAIHEGVHYAAPAKYHKPTYLPPILISEHNSFI